MTTDIKEYVYYVSGTHCPSCEILIEKKILAMKNIKSAQASTAKGQVVIKYSGERPSAGQLNEIFQQEKYAFFDQPAKNQLQEPASLKTTRTKEFFISLGLGLFIVACFVGLSQLGLSSWINVNSKSSLPLFFVFGLVAGLSSCAALVGGIILSMSKQWAELYSNHGSAWQKFQPHLMFNAGRLISYGLLGAVLGAIGNRLNFSFRFGPFLVIAVSLVMMLLALQMLGVKALKKFQLTLPKSLTRSLASESNFKGCYMPFLMGALTFLLPCGFTITAQSLALISGGAFQGGLIMLFFALGTLPGLLFIGFSSVKFSGSKILSGRFLKAAGVLVLFFALYNINSQLNVLGAKSLSDLNIKAAPFASSVGQNDYQNQIGLPPVTDGRQILKMEASSRGYTPNYFQVMVDIPVRWEITDTGTSGCTNAVISQGLFEGEIPLTPGKVSVKEFTPTNTGRFKFSCWMGMVSGIIEVVNVGEATDQSVPPAEDSNLFFPSGAENSGDVCGMSGAGGCGGR